MGNTGPQDQPGAGSFVALTGDVTSTPTGGATTLNGTAAVETLFRATSPDELTPLRADLNANGFGIANLLDPSLPQGAATANYVDLRALYPCRLATVAPLPANTYANGAAGVGATLTATANGALSVDGVAAAVGDRILVLLEAAAANDGIYTVTAAGGAGAPYVLTRATDYDTAAQMIPGSCVLIAEGATQAGYGFYMNQTAAIVVGTTSITWKLMATRYMSTITLTGGADVPVAAATETVLGTSAALPSGLYLFAGTVSFLSGATGGKVEIGVKGGTGVLYAPFSLGLAAEGTIAASGWISIPMAAVVLVTTGGTFTISAYADAACTAKQTTTHFASSASSVVVTRVQ